MKFAVKFKKLRIEFIVIFLGLFVAGLMALLFFVFNPFGGRRHNESDDFLKLSSADLASDFDYCFDFLEKNSPIFAIALRKTPNLREKAKECREEILNSKSNFEQLNLINSFLYFSFNGHSGLLIDDLEDLIDDQFTMDYDDYVEFEEHCDLDDNLKILLPQVKDYDREVFNQEQLKIKSDFEKLFADPQIFENTKKYAEFCSSERGDVLFKNRFKGSDQLNAVSRVEFSVLKPDKIAYIKIPSCAVVNESEKQRYMDFYRKISNYENLIIDLRGNRGGKLGYVHYLLPIFKKSFELNNVALIQLGPHFKKWETELEFPYLEIFGLCVSKKKGQLLFKPVSELPDMPALDSSDVKCATHFLNLNKAYGFVRKGPTDFDFHGKVYLLVNGLTASTAGLITNMAVASKEVTVIGTPTRRCGFVGWGMFTLPKSKVVARYETANVLNEDGSSQLEFGIKPDVFYRGEVDMVDWLVDKLESPGGFDVKKGDSVADMIEENLEKNKKISENLKSPNKTL